MPGYSHCHFMQNHCCVTDNIVWQHIHCCLWQSHMATLFYNRHQNIEYIATANQWHVITWKSWSGRATGQQQWTAQSTMAAWGVWLVRAQLCLQRLCRHSRPQKQQNRQAQATLATGLIAGAALFARQLWVPEGTAGWCLCCPLLAWRFAAALTSAAHEHQSVDHQSQEYQLIKHLINCSKKCWSVIFLATYRKISKQRLGHTISLLPLTSSFLLIDTNILTSTSFDILNAYPCIEDHDVQYAWQMSTWVVSTLMKTLNP